VSSVGLQPDQQVQTRPNHTQKSNPLHLWACGILLALLSLALYYPARSHPFVNYDDNLYVTDNDNLKAGLTWDTVTWAMTSYEAGNWHPLTWLSHALDVQLYGMDPAGHHQTSLLLHAVNAMLVFWVLMGATRRLGPSFMVAALFAVHPLNVEAVVWVAERKTVLSMTFLLLALVAYNYYAAKPKLSRYLPVALLFALGLMAKPQIITFPFVLLLWDYWPLRRISLHRGRGGEQPAPQTSWRALIAEKLPLFAIAAASAALTMRAQRSAHAVLSFGAIPLSIRLSNALVSYVRYLQKTIWPARLAPMYPHPGNTLPAWQVYGALLFLMSITLWALEQRGRRYLIVGWLWFVGTLVPMIGLVQVGRQAMADRYAYLPLLGIFFMVCWGVADWLQTKPRGKALLPIAGVLVVVSLAMVARRQVGYWADNAVLWTHTIEVTPPNYIAQDNLGATLLARKQPEQAIAHFREAAALHPTDPISVFNIGVYEQEHGNLQQAIDDYRQAIILTTRTQLKVLALQNMGHAYSDLGDADHARQCFDTARTMQGP